MNFSWPYCFSELIPDKWRDADYIRKPTSEPDPALQRASYADGVHLGTCISIDIFGVRSYIGRLQKHRWSFNIFVLQQQNVQS